jgi:hypothetical protein
MMTFRNKIYVTIFALLEFIAVLFFLSVAANAAQAGDKAPEEEIIAGPEPHDMSLVAFSPWVVEGEIVGALAGYVYDDVTTERDVDFWELYDNEGNLLAVSWFDKFGIERVAVDRGVLEQQGAPEGVFVLVTDGDSI